MARSVGLVILMAVFLLGSSYSSGELLAAEGSSKATSKQSKGKTRAYHGNPTFKRGLELGADQGVKAGKLDLSEGKDPDLTRHKIYNDPRPFYRYEFGNQGSFTRGFHAGFLKGYRHAMEGKKVPFKSPIYSDSGMAMSASRVYKPKPKKKRGVHRSVVVSDAL